ncbi:oxidoreductase [Gordonia sihwensis]|uniref:thioredoxin domain-containing protein n=1 Tax=Gordonia TaxID=2053 RepID=UPI001C92C688|nr:thioredoxin domain-containing protein [Gordonia sihwensis]MBY4569916.1 oxidoreductase [Gordonia sihwensis]WFN91960.1 thioredoxin domain-containing protein [Gordonia sihwensis]
MAPDRTSLRRSRLVPIVAVLAGIAAIAFVVIRSSHGVDGSADRAGSAASTPVRSEWEDRDPTDPMTFGPVDAPVGLVVFTDYQCPYCAKWSHDTLPALLPYADAGDLRIELRDMNIFGDGSERAARAAYSAALQGHLREFHAALFADGRPRPKSALSDDALLALAGELRLDTGRFRTDYESRTVLSAVRNKASDGFTAGTYSTPAFILGGQPILGAQPTKVFTDKLRSELDAAGR